MAVDTEKNWPGCIDGCGLWHYAQWYTAKWEWYI